MGARSGNNYLSALRKLKAQVWLEGTLVEDPTVHPAFVHCARSIASLYDMQIEHPEAMTYRSERGGRAGMSFVQPKNSEDVRKRGLMFRRWAEYSGGMLAETPDHLNAAVAAMAAASDYFAESDRRFGDNIREYWRQASDHDWCLARAMPKSGASSFDELADPELVNNSLAIVDRSGEGIVVQGEAIVRSLGGLAEELLILPPPGLMNEPKAESCAIAFAINCDAKGLKFLCRDKPDRSRSHFDAPLSSRFDGNDGIASLDNVSVPWERVFLCGDIPRCNALVTQTSAAANMMHQTAVRMAVKAEFLLGIAAKLAEVNNRPGSSRMHERLAEMIVAAELMRACIRAAEADAHQDRWGEFVPARAPLEVACNLFRRLHPRLIEIIQLNSYPNLVATPSEADFSGPRLPEIERYFGTDGAAAKDRAALYRLAWDVACSSFAGRQILHERLSYGDTVQTGAALVDAANLAPFVKRVDEFLKRRD